MLAIRVFQDMLCDAGNYINHSNNVFLFDKIILQRGLWLFIFLILLLIFKRIFGYLVRKGSEFLFGKDISKESENAQRENTQRKTRRRKFKPRLWGKNCP